MKAKHWLYLFPMLLLLLALAGCQSEPTLEERGYTVKVTYDYNGGTADSESRRVLYYKPGQPLLAPGDSVEFKEPTLDRFHSLDGWYLALTDAEGELLRGEDGSILTADTPFVWEDALATQSCTLVARWREKPAVELVVPGQQNILYPVDEGTRVTENMLGAALPDLPDQTFFDYFTDPECTQRAEFPLQMQQGQRVTLYTRWLEGDVLVVREPSDLNSIVLYTGKTVYLDADLDFGGAALPRIQSFGGQFLGNGHTLRNFSQTVSLTGRNASYGLFGELTDGAVIRDVTFEDGQIAVEASYSTQSLFHIGFLAGSVRGSVTLEGVAFDGCTLSLSLPTGAVNAGATGQPYEGILAGVAPDATVTYRGEGSVELTAPAPAATQSTQKGNKDPK